MHAYMYYVSTSADVSCAHNISQHCLHIHPLTRAYQHMQQHIPIMHFSTCRCRCA